MSRAWIDAPTLTPEGLEKFLTELDDQFATGTKPPVTRDSYRVLDSVRAVWEARLDQQMDRWRDARVRFQRAYERYTGMNFQKRVEEIADGSAPLIKEILQDDPSPAVPAWVQAKLRKMSEHSGEMPPVNTAQ